MSVTERSDTAAARSASACARRTWPRTRGRMRKLTAPWCAWRSVGRTVEQRAQRPQRGRLVLVVPQGLEVLGVGLERRAGGLDGESEHALGERQARLPGERDVRDERRRTRRAVDQGHALLRLEVQASAEVVEEPAERDDLARAAVALAGDLRERRAEHAGHLARDLRAHGGVTIDEVGQAREHDGAHDAVGERLAEGVRRPEPGRAGGPAPRA